MRLLFLILILLWPFMFPMLLRFLALSEFPVSFATPVVVVAIPALASLLAQLADNDAQPLPEFALKLAELASLVLDGVVCSGFQRSCGASILYCFFWLLVTLGEVLLALLDPKVDLALLLFSDNFLWLLTGRLLLLLVIEALASLLGLSILRWLLDHGLIWSQCESRLLWVYLPLVARHRLSLVVKGASVLCLRRCILGLNVGHWIEQRLPKLVVCVLRGCHLRCCSMTCTGIRACTILPSLVSLIHFYFITSTPEIK